MRESDVPVYHIRTLTPELAASVRGEMLAALNGDGSCSLDNQRVSCFASESCARGARPPATTFEASPTTHAFAALDGAGHLLGCVRATPARGGMIQALFPPIALGERDLLLSSLCVAHAWRKKGIGATLVRQVLSVDAAADVYLCIARLNDKHVDKLLKIYGDLGFSRCGVSERYILMCHPATPSAA